MDSPSKVLVQYLKMPPAGTERAEHEGRCVMCGGTYAKGEPIEPWAPQPSFTEYSDLQNPAGAHICGSCVAVLARGKDFTQSYTKSVVCKEGVFGFFSNDAVTHWLLNPPEPPYLMFISTQQQGHIVWKAPVNLSRERMFVRYNDKVLAIRRSHLLAALESAKALSEAKIAYDLAKEEQEGKKRKGKPPAFIAPIRMDRSLESAEMGQLATWVDTVAQGDPALMHAAQTLRTATIGEVWALTHVLYSKAPGSEQKLRPGQ